MAVSGHGGLGEASNRSVETLPGCRVGDGASVLRESAQDQGRVPAQSPPVRLGQSLPLLLGLSVPVHKWGS